MYTRSRPGGRRLVAITEDRLPDKILLDARTVENALGLSKYELRVMVQSGTLEPCKYREGMRKWYFRRDDVVKLMKKEPREI